jgi:hypothetical protein
MHQRMNALRFLLAWLLAAALLLPGSTKLQATTVVAVKETCPACEKAFLSSGYGSWFQFEEPERDFTGTSYVASLRIEVCPHCLYAAPDLEKLTPAEQKRVRAALAALPAGLRSFGRPLPPPGPARERALSSVRQQLVQLCDAQRNPNPARAATLALMRYYGATDSEKADATRSAITALRTWLADDAIAREHTDMVYLQGELERRIGRTKAAVATLTRVLKMANADSGTAVWAREQRRLAERGITTTKPSAVDSSDSVAENARRLRPRLDGFVRALKAGRPSREWLLPSPRRDAVHDTLSAANRLAKQGNARAVEYVVRWLAQVETTAIDRYPEPYCLQALAEQPALAARVLPSVSFRAPRMAEAVRYASGVSPAPTVTSEALRGRTEWLPTDTGILMAATIRRDPVFKPILLSSRMRAKHWQSGESSSYLLAVAEVADLLRIKAAVQRIRLPREVYDFTDEVTMRGQLESLLLEVQLLSLASQLSSAR